MGPAGDIRVVISGDHRLFREGLRLILGREKGIEIVGEAAHGPQTIQVVSERQPHVLLLDITIPGMDATELIARIRQKSPHTRPLMLTPATDEALILRALKAGAKGYLSKDAGFSDLLKAILAVHQGELWVERKLIARSFEREAFADPGEGDQRPRAKDVLTAREQEILRVLASGGTNKDIAQALFISERTVKCHLNSIFKKLHVTRRLQAILYAIHRGLS